jgi:hypothetical protein
MSLVNPGNVDWNAVAIGGVIIFGATIIMSNLNQATGTVLTDTKEKRNAIAVTKEDIHGYGGARMESHRTRNEKVSSTKKAAIAGARPYVKQPGSLSNDDYINWLYANHERDYVIEDVPENRTEGGIAIIGTGVSGRTPYVDRNY